MSFPLLRRCLALTLPLVLAACAQAREARPPSSEPPQPSATQSPTTEPSRYENYGAVFGQVTRGPLPPAAGVAAPPGAVPGGEPAPVGGAQVGLSPEGSEHVWWAVTGVYGDYGFMVPAGTYRVVMETRPGMGVAKNLPATVVVKPGERTRFDIHLDTGLR